MEQIIIDVFLVLDRSLGTPGMQFVDSNNVTDPHLCKIIFSNFFN